MSTGEYSELSPEEKQRVEAALEKAFPNGPSIIIEAEQVRPYLDGRLVTVRPSTYPEQRWDFMYGIASAEIFLRDGGLNIRLEPNVPQRMLVVATLPGGKRLAYLTVDGQEYRDLAARLGMSESSLSPTGFAGYAYDSEDDLRDALADARKENPLADFGGIAEPSPKSA